MEKAIMTVKEKTEHFQNEANKLAEYYQIKRPLVVFRNKLRSNYRPSIHLMAIALRSADITTSFLHEFAHHLNTCRGGGGHDKGFKRSIWSVAKRFYGDPLKYSWSREYPNVRKYYERKINKKEETLETSNDNGKT